MPKPDLTFVVVTYHSAKVLPACLDSLRRETDSLGVSLEVVVVEQSEAEEEVERVRSLRPDLLLSEPNLGYAAGVNRGLAHLESDSVLIANPDLVFQPGSVGALLDALDQGWGIVGPQLELAGVLFPPAEEQSLRAEWSRQRARSSESRQSRYLQTHFEEASRLWNASATVPVPTLSGCLLACRRRVVESLGPWDQDYFLYFEETEWLLRARRRGIRIGQVPEARVVHRWGHSADPVVQGARFQTSRERYFRRRYGPLGTWLAQRQSPRPPCPTPWQGSVAAAHPKATWLVSASPFAFPAGRLPAGTAPLDSLAAFEQLSPGDLPFLVWGIDSPSRRILGPYVGTPSGESPAGTAPRDR